MNWLYGAIGILFGLGVAYFANKVLLPYVLEEQRRATAGESQHPAPVRRLAPSAMRWTPFIYKYMYFFFPFVFGILGLSFVGKGGLIACRSH